VDLTPRRKRRISRQDAKTQRLGEVRILEPEPKRAMGYARSLEFGDEIEGDFTECFLTFASWRLGVRSFFGVLA
jgi:hypothetical protein